MWNEQLHQDNKAALLSWVKETGIQVVEVTHDGKRKNSSPLPGLFGGPAPSGTEAYIGKSHRIDMRIKLIPLFQSVGKLYEFCLMIIFSGFNRSFAYAMYMDRYGAQKASRLLNIYKIQKGHQILVCRSTNKCEICMDGLTPLVKEDQFLPMLQELTTGVLSKNRRQLAEMKYISHQAAAIAKKALVEVLCV
ncbi:dead end protein homolog 1-like [Anolis carolinensis]|uniref:dead end protein homolog 1-like n=1 Tax=Anolis carolinensis TaxID=28377 RepID=UPI002F2B4CF1